MAATPRWHKPNPVDERLVRDKHEALNILLRKNAPVPPWVTTVAS